MMRNGFLKRAKQAAAAFMAAVTMTASLPSMAVGGVPEDINGHWAETEIKQGMNKGFIKGYPDGNVKPNNPVTRAEFSKMLNLALGVTATTDISMTDVNSSDWYYNEVRKAVAAGYISGYTDNTFRPKNNISRQEAANMIAKVLPEFNASADLSELADYSEISSWARDGVKKVYARGYMKGDNKKKYNPNGPLKRAEACAILVRLLEGEGVVSGSYTIDKKGTSLSNKIYTGNLTISKDVADGDVTLKNIVVFGTLTVLGGGESTVNLTDSRINQLNVSKSSGDVRVLLSGNSLINDTTVNNGAILEQKNISGEGFKKIVLSGSSLASQKTTFKGNFANVVLERKSLVNVYSGKITNLSIGSGASSSEVDINSGASIGSVTANAKVAFKGEGKISELKAYANDITYQTKPSTITTGSNVSKPPVLAEDKEGPVPTFTPKNDATNVAIDTKITVVFDEPIYLEGGGKVTASSLEDVFELRKSSQTGTELDFSAEISSDKKTVTITPDSTLDVSTTYYVILLKETLEDEKENENVKTYSSFKTGTATSGAPVPTFSPAKDAKNVAANTKIKITFNEAIQLKSGSEVKASNIDDFVEIRETSTSGTSKSFSATIDSKKKVIEITPSAALKDGKDYYIIILGDKIQDSDKNVVSKTTSKFTVGAADVAAPVPSFSPANNATNISAGTKVTITFNEAIILASGSAVTNSNINTFVELRESSATGTTKTFSATIDSAKKVIQLTPSAELDVDKNYYVIILASKIKDEAGNSVPKTTSTFRTSLPQVSTPTITTSANTAANNETITVTLASATAGTSIYYTTNGATPTSTVSATNKLYAGSFTVENENGADGETKNIKAIAVKTGMSDSAVASKSVTFESNRVATPSITTSPSSVSAVPSTSTVEVTITAAAGATVYYTTDGSTPTTSSDTYGAPFTVSTANPEGETVVIKAIAVELGKANSIEARKNIVFIDNRVAKPTYSASPATTVTEGTIVRIELDTATSGADIYVSVDGAAAFVYTGGFDINEAAGTVTIEAIAKKAGMTDSDTRTITITFTAAP